MTGNTSLAIRLVFFLSNLSLYLAVAGANSPVCTQSALDDTLYCTISLRFPQHRRHYVPFWTCRMNTSMQFISFLPLTVIHPLSRIVAEIHKPLPFKASHHVTLVWLPPGRQPPAVAPAFLAGILGMLYTPLQPFSYSFFFMQNRLNPGRILCF